MYSKLQLLSKFIQYQLRASNGRGHGIHSPFVFDFVTKVMSDNRSFYCYQSIELLRKELMQNNELILIEDFGAGSRVETQKRRKISSVAANSLKPKKFSQLLFRMVNYYQPQTILELGTSLGITASYLACAKSDAAVITMEGAQSIAAIAKQNFNKLSLQNIQIVEGNFDNTLPSVLEKISGIDFTFIDGNHRKEPTISYYQQLLRKANEYSVFVFDDIHWSKEMEEAWEEIKSFPVVTLTIDLFFIGIVFFRKQNKEKQHFIIRF